MIERNGGVTRGAVRSDAGLVEATREVGLLAACIMQGV